MAHPYMILKDDKIIGHEPSLLDVEGLIRRDFRVKKQSVYEVKDLKTGKSVCVEEFVQELHALATPRKKIKFTKPKPIKSSPPKQIKFPPRKQYDPSMYKQRKAGKPLKRTAIKSKPFVFIQKPYVPAKPRVIKPRKLRRNDIIDDKYSKWLGTQPCVVTGMSAERGAGPNNIHCHHIKGRVPRNDFLQVPLLGLVHSWGNLALHNLGKHSFLEAWKHKLIGVEDVTEYFKDHALAFKEQYDLENKEKKNN